MKIDPKEQCGAYDKAIRCRRNGVKRWGGAEPPLCRMHYERMRSNGTTKRYKPWGIIKEKKQSERAETEGHAGTHSGEVSEGD